MTGDNPRYAEHLANAFRKQNVRDEAVRRAVYDKARASLERVIEKRGLTGTATAVDMINSLEQTIAAFEREISGLLSHPTERQSSKDGEQLAHEPQQLAEKGDGAPSGGLLFSVPEPTFEPSLQADPGHVGLDEPLLEDESDRAVSSAMPKSPRLNKAGHPLAPIKSRFAALKAKIFRGPGNTETNQVAAVQKTRGLRLRSLLEKRRRLAAGIGITILVIVGAGLLLSAGIWSGGAGDDARVEAGFPADYRQLSGDALLSSMRTEGRGQAELTDDGSVRIVSVREDNDQQKQARPIVLRYPREASPYFKDKTVLATVRMRAVPTGDVTDDGGNTVVRVQVILSPGGIVEPVTEVFELGQELADYSILADTSGGVVDSAAVTLRFNTDLDVLAGERTRGFPILLHSVRMDLL